MAHYPAIVHKDADSVYGVSFPDFPGCIAAGDTLDEAYAQAIEALRFHVEGMEEDGETVPAPSALDTVDLEGGGLAFVPLIHPEGKTLRVNITLDRRYLRVIDVEAKRRGLNRSAFLTAAALKTIEPESGSAS